MGADGMCPTRDNTAAARVHGPCWFSTQHKKYLICYHSAQDVFVFVPLPLSISTCPPPLSIRSTCHSATQDKYLVFYHSAQEVRGPLPLSIRSTCPPPLRTRSTFRSATQHKYLVSTTQHKKYLPSITQHKKYLPSASQHKKYLVCYHPAQEVLGPLTFSTRNTWPSITQHNY